jgi:hypothetical protein
MKLLVMSGQCRSAVEGAPRYLIQERKVSAGYALGLIVVFKAQNGKLVLGGVKDMRISTFPGSNSE